MYFQIGISNNHDNIFTFFAFVLCTALNLTANARWRTPILILHYNFRFAEESSVPIRNKM